MKVNESLKAMSLLEQLAGGEKAIKRMPKARQQTMLRAFSAALGIRDDLEIRALEPYRKLKISPMPELSKTDILAPIEAYLKTAKTRTDKLALAQQITSFALSDGAIEADERVILDAVDAALPQHARSRRRYESAEVANLHAEVTQMAERVVRTGSSAVKGEDITAFLAALAKRDPSRFDTVSQQKIVNACQHIIAGGKTPFAASMAQDQINRFQKAMFTLAKGGTSYWAGT